ncbi:class V chitinase isoform X2 [Ziziphus jujuba]|uniref:Class V chitinase isoform X2 n=1 Tax=Ziziphus jujuba TaxID=326968 RepID=A0A6P6FWI8_ZIZJJ|nr:class V chitinase isoform X2 [Ziziphus jujuba]
MESKNIIIILFHIILSLKLQHFRAQSWIQAGYWYYGTEFPISNINSALFTHLICAFADVNSSSYELSIPSSHEQQFSSFTNTLKQSNPSISTLLSIGGEKADYSVISTLVSSSSYRKSFIDSSIKVARLYAFQGLDLAWSSANTTSDMENMGKLFEEWRAAVNSEVRNSGLSQLILTANVKSSPDAGGGPSLPVDSIFANLDWVHVMAIEYHNPDWKWEKFTAPQAALYDPSTQYSVDYSIKQWIATGSDPKKLVLGLPYYGHAWTLTNPTENSIGSPAIGPANISTYRGGSPSYKDIKDYVERNNAQVIYNATYVMKHFSVGSIWVNFDDADIVTAKVSYAKEKKLLGYVAWEVSHDDDNWMLSHAAKESVSSGGKPKRRIIIIVSTTTASATLILVYLFCYFWRRKLKSKAKVSKFNENKRAAAGDFNNNAPNLQVFTLADIEAATERFSIENKLGQGGYGPVYKGILPNGQEIAVKKLSAASTQGFEEFKNEVSLTAKLQHVNLVKVLGFCIEQDEQMLIYEYMPNMSLDMYLFDPIRKYILDWGKRVHIIEGITQGLLYLQEYSRLTIIHRDLKASNILLDDDMKPKISDFGMAKIFTKDGDEANTERIVGTYGYIPPEYVRQGLYSTKSDVYSFGVLLLQIISGKRTSAAYGVNEDLSILEYVCRI